MRFKDLPAQKLRGGYYTPDPLGAFLAGYLADGGCRSVLEPSSGDGQLLVAAERAMPEAEIVGVELMPEEAERARERVGNTVEVVASDLFGWYRDARSGSLDGVIGNPPFIRYQSFPASYRDEAMAFMRSRGLSPNRMTNAWVPFVVVSVDALREGGRLAMVLPAELLQVNYAGELRSYLAAKFSELHLVTFRSLVFEGIQQETVLLLGQKGPGPASIVTHDLADERNLPGYVLSADRAEATPSRMVTQSEKWTRYWLRPNELGLMRELVDSPDLLRLGSYADVNVGIVTGRNAFFVMTGQEADERGLAASCVDLVGRSAQTPGLIHGQSDQAELRPGSSRSLLLQLGNTDRDELPAEALAWVKHGESLGYHKGYKCRIRLPNWWQVPSDWRPDGFMLRQIYEGPRLIVNESDATCTDTLHRVRLTGDATARQLAVACMNSMTWAFAEIIGRSYGGGVLELEPREAIALPIPTPGDEGDLEEFDLLARAKRFEDVLDEVDRLYLKAQGLTSSEIELLRSAWRRLSTRRRGRK